MRLLHNIAICFLFALVGNAFAASDAIYPLGISTTTGQQVRASTAYNTLSGASHAAVTLSGAYDYITLSGQDIVRGQIDFATDVTGTMLAAQMPALTGDVTNSAGSLATAIGAGKVTNTMLAGSIDLTTKVTGILPIANGGSNKSSFTSGSVLFFDGTRFQESNSKLFWDDSNSGLGIGTASPDTSYDVTILGADGTAAGMKIQAFKNAVVGARPQLDFYAADGTNASPSSIGLGGWGAWRQFVYTGAGYTQVAHFGPSVTPASSFDTSLNFATYNDSAFNDRLLIHRSVDVIKDGLTAPDPAYTTAATPGSLRVSVDGEFVGDLYIGDDATIGDFLQAKGIGVNYSTDPGDGNIRQEKSTGTATLDPVVLDISSLGNAGDWDTTLDWGIVRFRTADTTSSGPKIEAQIGARKTGVGGGSSKLDFYSTVGATLTRSMVVGASLGSVIIGDDSVTPGTATGTGDLFVQDDLEVDGEIHQDGSTANVFAGVLGAPDGSTTVPGFNFSGDTNNGMYRVGTDNIGLVAGGSEMLDLTTTNVSVKTGSSTLAKMGGILTTVIVTVGNVGGGTDDLMTYSIPAGSLATNGDTIHVVCAGIFAANANNKTLTLVYGGTTLISTGAVAFNAADWHIEAWITRTGATTQRAIAMFSSGSTLLTSSSDYTTPAETLSGAVTIKCTGLSGSSATDDIQQTLMKVYWEP